MPRLRQVSRDDASAPTVTAMYDFIFGPDRDPVDDPGTATGTPGDWWTTFALVPDVLEHCVAGFGLYRSPQRTLPAELRELGQFRAGWCRQSQFVYSQHAKSCRALGMPEEKIAALPHWAVADCWSPAERAVLGVTAAPRGVRRRLAPGRAAGAGLHRRPGPGGRPGVGRRVRRPARAPQRRADP